MAVDLEAERLASLKRLDDLEAIVLEVQERTGRSQAARLARIRATRRRIEGPVQPVLRLPLPAGATAQERQAAVINAVIERLNKEES